jgi:hypothetical protein
VKKLDWKCPVNFPVPYTMTQRMYTYENKWIIFKKYLWTIHKSFTCPFLYLPRIQSLINNNRFWTVLLLVKWQYTRIITLLFQDYFLFLLHHSKYIQNCMNWHVNVTTGV